VSAGPGDYIARRFDVVARPVNGSLDVTETITFEFQSGTFRKVWREIPATRTDGIDVIGAAIDGSPATLGDGPGHITISGRTHTRVEWQFVPVGLSVHVFTLHYVARGVVYRDGPWDVLRWRALPAEHRYAIDASRVQVESGSIHDTPLETHRVDHASVATTSTGVDIEASGIHSNGWLIADLRYPAGRLIQAQPQWRQRETDAAVLAPRWMLAAAVLLAIGLALIVLTRQGYPSSSIEIGDTTAVEPPEALPAALAAALIGNGRMLGHLAGATLLDLADRGVLTVRELPRRLCVRDYELSQVPGRHDLANHEAEALSIAFGGRGDPVSLSMARRRLARRTRRFALALESDLATRGLLDPDRKAVRNRLMANTVILLLTGAASCILVVVLMPRYGPWPFLLSLALVVSGVAGLITAAATPALSDEGLVQAARWRGFKRHLRALAASRGETGAGAVPSRWIIYGVAAGLAYQWSRYLKRYPAAAPPWFVAAAHDDAGAFAAFVGSNAVSTSAGSGGAAAGGGSSGAA